MTYSLAAFLGALQGVTEFFPVSSSGHLLLAEHFFSLSVADLQAFDVVLHAGTLLALLLLFRREWAGIVVGGYRWISGKSKKEDRGNLKLFLQLIVVTLPAAIVGLVWGDAISEAMRGENRIILVAGFLAATAVVLFAAEKFSRQSVTRKVGWSQIVGMGFAQALALLPGVSRSGMTIAAGMLGGLSRATAARFSFLMLAPVTLGAAILIAGKVSAGELNLPAAQFTATGFAVSAVVSYIAAAALLKFVQKHSLKVFAAYLLAVAAGLAFLA